MGWSPWLWCEGKLCEQGNTLRYHLNHVSSWSRCLSSVTHKSVRNWFKVNDHCIYRSGRTVQVLPKPLAWWSTRIRSPNGLKVCIAGTDHSRVAKSNMQILKRLGQPSLCRSDSGEVRVEDYGTIVTIDRVVKMWSDDVLACTQHERHDYESLFSKERAPSSSWSDSKTLWPYERCAILMRSTSEPWRWYGPLGSSSVTHRRTNDNGVFVL